MTSKLTREQLLADIAHAEEKSTSLCGQCAEDHARLAHWLRIALAAMDSTQEPLSDAERAELQQYRKARSETVNIDDDMAFAFCRAISDDAVGANEIEDIKTGLRAAFANVAAPPAPVVLQSCSPVITLPVEFYSEHGIVVQLEKVMAVLAVNGIRYERSGSVGNSPVIPDGTLIGEGTIPEGWQLVPKEPTQAMIKAWLSEICDFFAGLGNPGEPETPEAMQRKLLARISPLLAGMDGEPRHHIKTSSLPAAPEQEVKPVRKK